MSASYTPDDVYDGAWRSVLEREQRDQAAHDMRSALNAALVALALRETDPVERAAKLQILQKDGWL